LQHNTPIVVPKTHQDKQVEKRSIPVLGTLQKLKVKNITPQFSTNRSPPPKKKKHCKSANPVKEKTQRDLTLKSWTSSVTYIISNQFRHKRNPFPKPR